MGHLFIHSFQNSSITSKTKDPVSSHNTQTLCDRVDSSSKLEEIHRVPAESVVKQEPVDTYDDSLACKCCKSRFRTKNALKVCWRNLYYNYTGSEISTTRMFCFTNLVSDLISFLL